MLRGVGERGGVGGQKGLILDPILWGHLCHFAAGKNDLL